MLILMPLLILALGVMLSVLARLLPQERRTMTETRAYLIGWIGVVLFLLIFHTLTVINAAGGHTPIPRVIFAILGAVYLVLGRCLPTTKNAATAVLYGRWAPETPKSSQRLAGFLFLALGALLLVAAFFVAEPVLLLITIAGTFIAGLTPTIHAWWTWRDPAKSDLATGGPAKSDLATGDPAKSDPATGDPATGDPATGDLARGDSATGDPAKDGQSKGGQTKN